MVNLSPLSTRHSCECEGREIEVWKHKKGTEREELNFCKNGEQILVRHDTVETCRLTEHRDKDEGTWSGHAEPKAEKVEKGLKSKKSASGTVGGLRWRLLWWGEERGQEGHGSGEIAAHPHDKWPYLQQRFSVKSKRWKAGESRSEGGCF